MTNLGRILSIISGEAFKKKDYTNSGVKLLQIANVSFGEIVWEQQNFLPEDIAYQFPEIILKENDVVIALNRPIIGGRLKIARLKRQDTPSILYQRVGCFKSIDNDLTKYFFLYGQSHVFLKYIQENLQGSDQPYINTSCLPKLTIPIPPLNEQRRIVEKVEALMARSRKAKEALDAIPKLIEQFRQSILAAAFRGDLTADWREQNPNIEPASVLLDSIQPQKQSELIINISENQKKLPNKWNWSTLERCFLVERGKFSIRPRNDPSCYGGEYPFIQIGDLPREGGLIENYSQTLNEKGFKVSKLFPKGSVFIAIVGATIGNTGILTFDSCCPDSLVAIQSHDEELSQYIEYYLRQQKDSIREYSYASGGQPNINLQTLKPLLFPLPPYLEIKQINRKLRSLDEFIEKVKLAVEETKFDLNSLNQSILSKAFRGELVEQDPTDEPASVLLERIQKEREKEKAKVKQTGAKKLKK